MYILKASPAVARRFFLPGKADSRLRKGMFQMKISPVIHPLSRSKQIYSESKDDLTR